MSKHFRSYSKFPFLDLVFYGYLIVCLSFLIGCSSHVGNGINPISIKNTNSNKINFFIFDEDCSSENLDINGYLYCLNENDSILSKLSNDCNVSNRCDMMFDYYSHKTFLLKDILLCDISDISFDDSSIYLNDVRSDIDEECLLSGNLEDKIKWYIRYAALQRLNLCFYRYYLLFDVRIFEPRVDILNFRIDRDKEGLVFTGSVRVSFAERKKILPVPLTSRCTGAVLCWVDVKELEQVKFKLKLETRSVPVNEQK